jgi:SagB-type dehydrogenase family enzyme
MMTRDQIEESLARLGMYVRPSYRFHQETKINQPSNGTDPSAWPLEWTTVYYKGYPRLPAIQLPKATLKKSISLVSTLERRESSRAFSTTPLTLHELSTLLYYAAGLRKPDMGGEAKRFYPSAGARYPLEVYPVAMNVADIRPGLYHYYVRQHALEILEISDEITLELSPFLSDDWMRKAPLVLAISAVFARSQMKYGERGYRHILVEAGHMCQNIYLVATALGISCCSSGGFVDNFWNNLIDLDDRLEAIVALIFLGRPLEAH